MFVIGITGGIGSGKSTVASLCREAGIPVIDADQISHSVTAPGGAAIPEILESFGQTVLAEDGSLDRRRMSELVFDDKKALDRLSLIVHRHVLAKMGEHLTELSRSGSKVAVLDVPIPVKHGFIDRCDQVWSVYADDAIRLRRLEQRGLSPSEAQRRMSIQMNREQYAELATYEVENNGDFDHLRRQINHLLESELQTRGLPFQKI